MSPASITPLILTWNEEANLRRCLEALRWAARVIVVDSGSTDATLAICEAFPNVEVVVRPFDNHTAQWNHGLDQIRTKWVLTLDADYVVNESFTHCMGSLPKGGEEVAWFAPFRFLVFGRPLRGSLYPPRAVLFDPSRSRYRADGHTQILEVKGPAGNLPAKIDHDDRKPLSRWTSSQWKYALLEAEKMEREATPGSLPDRIRKMIWPAAPLTFIYTLLVKGVILDGWAGWFYVLQRTCAEILLSLAILEKRLHRDASH